MKYVGLIFLCFISLVAYVIVGNWVYYSLIKINNTVDTGSGYGFNVGDSKLISYRKANKLIEQGEILGFDGVYPKETYNFVYNWQKIERVEEFFHRWDYWILTRLETHPSERIDFGFENGVLNMIGDAANRGFISLNAWPPKSSSGSIELEIGDTYSNVYDKLFKISKLSPQIRIQAANLSTYKLPKNALAEEYYLVKDYSFWKFRVSASYFSNSITLTFNANDELIQIHRNRYAFELP